MTAVMVFAITYFLCVWLVLLLMPLLVVMANLLLLPFETINNNRYITNAKNTLQKNKAVKIAIVGSYGKTTVKHILSTILSNKYSVGFSPNSFNTPIGIAKWINCTDITDKEILIFEFGARKRGDISTLFDIVKPNFAVLTGITEQHLSTFLSIENIIAEKTCILSLLNATDTAVINADDKILLKNSHIGDCKKVYSGKESKVCAQNVVCSSMGCAFDIFDGTNVYSTKTVLLGEQNVSNIMLCVNVGLCLDMNLSQIANSILQIEYIPHRLEKLTTKDFIILDDSYNANVNGVNLDVSVLKLFKGKKYVITQGIVETGKSSYQINFEVGKNLATVVDTAVVIGKNSNALARGLETKLSKSQILFASDVNHAVTLLKPILSNNSVLLFQNDIPNDL